MVIVPSNQSKSMFDTLVSLPKNCNTRFAEATGFSSPCYASAENCNKLAYSTYDPMP